MSYHSNGPIPAGGLPQEADRADRLFTIAEVSRIYFQGKVSVRTVGYLFQRGELKGFRVGRKILIYQSSLDAYRRLHENATAAPASEGANQDATSPPSAAEPSPGPSTQRRQRGADLPPIRLNRLPKPNP